MSYTALYILGLKDIREINEKTLSKGEILQVIKEIEKEDGVEAKIEYLRNLL